MLYLLKCVKPNYFWVHHFTTSVTKSYTHLWNFWRRTQLGMTNKPFLRKLFHFVCSHYPLVSLLAFVSSTKTLSTACKSPCETLCLTCWHKRNHLSRFPLHPLPAQWVTFRLKSIIGGEREWVLETESNSGKRTYVLKVINAKRPPGALIIWYIGNMCSLCRNIVFKCVNTVGGCL